MKLHRFTASSNQKAIAMIHEALGSDALVYSTRSVPNGVEIVAGMPNHFDEHYENEDASSSLQHADNLSSVGVDKLSSGNAALDINLFEKLNSQLQLIKESMKNLSHHVDKRTSSGLNIADDEQATQQNVLVYHLNKLGFKGKFCQQFINDYFKTRNISEPVTMFDIEENLMNCIQTTDADIIDSKSVCALIGPTGIGKTTTILKLAKRYISKYGADSLGIVTTDYHDISGKNLLLHYQSIYNIDLEYADTPAELSLVLKSMKHKKLVLIDTQGSSQRDIQNVVKLVELMESQGNTISPYIVLPTNVQEPILDEIARAFKTTNLQGCILTKQDECISLAPALSVAVNHQMKIAYICNGQDIVKDIVCATKERILHHIMNDNRDVKQEREENLFLNQQKMSGNSNEGRYER